jgi:para-nitrobenzyl esterase
MQVKESPKNNLEFPALRISGTNTMRKKHPKSLIALALMTAFLVTAASAQEPNNSKPEQPAKPAVTAPTVGISTGVVRGVTEGDISSFKGIPFAAAPVGENRWRPPQPLSPWQGVRDASKFGADCAQTAFRPGAVSMSPTSSEDCLFLNVWRPAGTASGAKLPVMFWIYGGGFTGGSSAMPLTSGTQLAKQGVILVAANYRVGRFGFFAFPALSQEHPDEPKGNYAYMDQIAALKWVKQNIAAFGGDPNNVTIFGSSAGGVSVHSLMTMPMARGLFQKAIVESGGSRDSVLTARPMSRDGVDPNYPVSAETIGINFARSMGIEGTDKAALTKLRALSAEQIALGAPAQPGDSVPSYETTPILDGKLITETAETAYNAHRQPRIPLMLGSNSGDTAGNRVRATTKEQLFARFGQWSAQAKAAYDPDGSKDLVTLVAEANDDFGQAEPARFAASEFATNGSPVYLYRFSYVQTGLRERLKAGTPHGGEIGFVFGTLGAGGFGPPPPPATDEDRAVSKMAQSYWVNFAKAGNPNSAGLPTWPRYDPSKGLIFEFHPDGTAGAIPDPWRARLDVMQKATESGKRADF